MDFIFHWRILTAFEKLYTLYLDPAKYLDGTLWQKKILKNREMFSQKIPIMDVSNYA